MHTIALSTRSRASSGNGIVRPTIRALSPSAIPITFTTEPRRNQRRFWERYFAFATTNFNCLMCDNAHVAAPAIGKRCLQQFLTTKAPKCAVQPSTGQSKATERVQFFVVPKAQHLATGECPDPKSSSRSNKIPPTIELLPLAVFSCGSANRSDILPQRNGDTAAPAFLNRRPRCMLAEIQIAGFENGACFGYAIRVCNG